MLAMLLPIIKKREEFLRAQAGLKAGSASILVIRSQSPTGRRDARTGLTVSRKVGGAVVRNRVRRRLREALKQVPVELFAPGYDYVFIARAAALTRPFPLLLDDLKRGLLRLSPHPK